jgi:hypothetical protein
VNKAVRALALTLVPLALAACTGSNGSTTPPSESAGLTANAPPGSYTYNKGEGVTALLTYTGPEAELEVENHSGEELPAPSVYLLRADDGSRVNATIADAAAIPDGETKTFNVEFASKIAEHDVGLIAFLVGYKNIGSFLPPQG